MAKISPVLLYLHVILHQVLYDFFFQCEGWGTNSTVSYRESRTCCSFKLSASLRVVMHLYAWGFVLWRHFLNKPCLRCFLSKLCATLLCTKSCAPCVAPARGCLNIRMLLTSQDVSLYLFISVIFTIGPVMSAQSASFQMSFGKSYAHTGRCLSLLFQL